MPSLTKNRYPPSRLAWSIWGLAALLYLYGFFHRVAPAVMTEELSADFGLSAASLGKLSAFYFYSYVAMQIPTGIMADLWGPRRLLTVGALLASLGCLLFAVAPNLLLAGLGRLLVGASVAVAFVCMLKLASHWFAPQQFAMVSGLALFIGVVGAVCAGLPLHLMVEAWGWRPVMAASAVLPLLLSVLIYLLIRDDPVEQGYQSHSKHTTQHEDRPWRHAFKGLKQVFAYRNTWLLSLVPGGIIGSILSFSGLWGVPFLSTHHGLDKGQAAIFCSAMMVCLAISSPLFGRWSDRQGRRKPLYVTGTLLTACGWCLIILQPNMPTSVLLTLLLITGFTSGSMILGFAFAKESVPAGLAGTVSGVVNMGVMAGPMILQPAVGWMLDRSAAGATGQYSLGAYQMGFALMAAWAVLSCLLILCTVEDEVVRAKSSV